MTEQSAISPETNGGLGGDREFGETGLTKRADSLLTELAIRRGWIKEQRWATNITDEELQKAQESRPLTLQERTLQTMLKDVGSGDARVRQIAARTVVAMESQNQNDDHKMLPSNGSNVGLSVDVNSGGSQEQDSSTGVKVVLFLPENGR